MPVDFANPLGWPVIQPSGTPSLPSWHEAVALGAMLCHSAITDEGLEPRRPVDADDIHTLREHLCAVLRIELLVAKAGARPPGWINDNPDAVCDEEYAETDPVPINVDPEDGDCEFLARWRLMAVAEDGRMCFELQTALSSDDDWNCLADLGMRPSSLRSSTYTMINDAFVDYVARLRAVRLATLLARAREWCRLHDMPTEEDLIAYTSASILVKQASMLRDVCAAIANASEDFVQKYRMVR